MKTEIQYRTFDELLNSVKIDIKGLDLEGMINDQELIKVAERVNFELGLKINMSKSKSLEVMNGKAKLPHDFYVLNFALHCSNGNILDSHLDYMGKWSYKTYDQGFFHGMIQAKAILNDDIVRQYSTISDIVPGQNIITHDLDTNYVIVQLTTSQGSILSFEFTVVDKNNISITSVLPNTVDDVRIIVMGTGSGSCPSDGIITQRPQCEIIEEEGCPPIVTDFKGGFRKEYKTLIPLNIIKSKSVSDDCVNVNSTSPFSAYLKNGYLITNFEEGTVFINYESTMEDDDGNLLVMDHPIVNEFYEYALKQRIYENLVLAGENMTGHLNLIEQRFRIARNNAISYVRTPDFKEIYENWHRNRKVMTYKYYSMFESRGPLPNVNRRRY